VTGLLRRWRDDDFWCQDCDEPVGTWSVFVAHANAGHAITSGPAVNP